MVQVDDDSYVHVNNLMAVMARVPQRRLFLGHIDQESGGPHRDPSNQWYVTKEEWPTEIYPYWAHGAGYVLSKVRFLPRCAEEMGLGKMHSSLRSIE